MFTSFPQYHSYVLRFWEERSSFTSQEPTWRFSLENVNTHTRYGFRNVEELVTFLKQHTKILN